MHRGGAGSPAPFTERPCRSHAYELGWFTFTNGDLIRLAEQEGYELLITTDTNLGYQQNLRSRSIATLVVTTTS